MSSIMTHVKMLMIIVSRQTRMTNCTVISKVRSLTIPLVPPPLARLRWVVPRVIMGTRGRSIHMKRLSSVWRNRFLSWIDRGLSLKM